MQEMPKLKVVRWLRFKHHGLDLNMKENCMILPGGHQEVNRSGDGQNYS